MSDDDRLLKARRDGAQAGDLLNNEAFTQAVESVKAEIISMWTQCKSAEERERAWLALNVTEKIAAALITTYNNGKLANAELDNLISIQERKRGLFR